MEDAAAHRMPLMLIHGAWLTSASWEKFAGHFRDRGFAVSAPEWPRKQGDVEEIREGTAEIEGLGLTEIVDTTSRRSVRSRSRPSWSATPTAA